MLHPTLNLGILAHVDAGKTTLSERLLYDAGVIRALGSVDRGTTQADTLALERARGITIKTAVVSFPLDGIVVNLIDTPGHPDFIAEVERALAVLDGAVLVLSAVEGVQAQTLVLWRALQRLRVPTLLFVNKTDRVGADVERVEGEIRSRLATDAGALAGSAMTGDGLDSLRRSIASLVPAPAAPASPLAAAVFKIERDRHREKVAYVRVFAGTLRVRERVGEDKVTGIDVFEEHGTVRRSEVAAGQIAQVRGLRSVRVGDRLGAGVQASRQFAPPTLESVVEPVDPADATRLKTALDELAEQDPLIGVRQRAELSVLLYGEVQKEVLEATLADDFGVIARFRDTTPVYVERPVGTGEAVELLNAPSNPFHAQVGLRVEPAPAGSGVAFRLAVGHRRVPLYAYKRREEFEAAMDEYVRDALRVGRRGREVTDCIVTMTDSWYSLADGPPSRRGPLSTPADFRGLTPLVLSAALERAGTVVCEPVHRIRVELPASALGATMAAAVRLGATLDVPETSGDRAVVSGELPALRVADLQRQVPGLTHGEGVVDSRFAGYRPAVSAVPG
ncbi:MAG TPA: translation factor GTPase family protein [Gaiellaceae bacterium]|nr:translation factor GTPase family protein [Gaiellaceae bacterium]